MDSAVFAPPFAENGVFSIPERSTSTMGDFNGSESGDRSSGLGTTTHAGSVVGLVSQGDTVSSSGVVVLNVPRGGSESITGPGITLQGGGSSQVMVLPVLNGADADSQGGQSCTVPGLEVAVTGSQGVPFDGTVLDLCSPNVWDSLIKIFDDKKAVSMLDTKGMRKAETEIDDLVGLVARAASTEPGIGGIVVAELLRSLKVGGVVKMESLRLAFSPAHYLQEVDEYCPEQFPIAVAPLLKRVMTQVMLTPDRFVPAAKFVVPAKRKLLLGSMVLADSVVVQRPTTSTTVSTCSTMCTTTGVSTSSSKMVSLTKSILAFSAADFGVVKKPRKGAGIKARGEVLRSKVASMGVTLLHRFGSVSIRYAELNEFKGETYANFLGVFTDLMFGRLTSECVKGYLREVDRFVDWTSAICVPCNSVSTLVLCGYLRNVRSRGHSVPKLVKAALVWAESVFLVSIGCGSRDVLNFVGRISTISSAGVAIDSPKKATLVPPEVIIQLESFVASSSSVPIRVFAGVALLCCHGIKRWGDVQHVSKMVLTDDALVVTTWRSKKKRFPLTWAALRRGFSGRDWAAPFLEALASANLPGEDFLVLRPAVNLQSFSAAPAKWADACRAVQAGLVLAGCKPEEAVSFSMHSFRHVYPTMARQLLVPDSVVGVMGSWASRDPMPGHYDSIDCTAELAYKEFVRSNYAAGWRLCGAGNVPTKAILPMGVPSHEPSVSSAPSGPVDDTPVETCFQRIDGAPLRQGADNQLQMMIDFRLPDDVVQVVNQNVGCVHLLKTPPNTVCNGWKCGSVDAPASSAGFAVSCSSHNGATSPFAFCRVCYTEKALLRIGASRVSDVVSSAGESESVSSSGSESSS